MTACIQDESEPNKGYFEAVKEAFIKRISIDDEFLCAAVLDPNQLYSDYLKLALENKSTSVQEILGKMMTKYEISLEPQISPNNSSTSKQTQNVS